MSGKLALVTGASGLIGSQVIHQLLQNGYRVRGTARGKKVEHLRRIVDVPGLEFVQIDDVAKSDLTEALQGVDVVLHVASPLPGAQSVDDTLNSAVQGTLNVLTQAEKAGVEKIVVTSSSATVIDPTGTRMFAGLNISEGDWGDVTVEEVYENAENKQFVYGSSKILAEKAVWEFAKNHPKVYIATILPSVVYGPYPPYLPPSSKDSLSTNSELYKFIKGEQPSSFPFVVDVRDVAKAHVLAIDLPRAAKLEDKRFLVHWGFYTWKDAAEHLKKTHPEITVVDTAFISEFPPTLSTLDATRSREVLKLEYTSPEKTVDDFIESMAEVEKIWARNVRHWR